MKKDEKKNPTTDTTATAAGAMQGGEQAPSSRPNRDAYSAMFSEDNPDIDFEDKEARYGRMSEERQRYRRYRDSGKELSRVFDENPWTAKMLMDLREHPDLNPITWMADNGIDIAEALSDEKYAKEVSERIAKYQEGQLKGKKEAEQRTTNLQESAKMLSSLQEEYGLNDEACGQLWVDFFEGIIEPALNGQVSADTWKMIIKANNYDNDIASAKQEGAMQARNEKIHNKLRQPNDVPPTLGQGGSPAPREPKKKEGFFDDLKE